MCHTLIIEDEMLLAIDMGDMAEEAGARSVAFAATEEEAVREARLQRPSFIFSDVHLREGHGPLAVQRIIAEHGPIATVFVTALPEQCYPCEDALAIIPKPAGSALIIETFRRFAPV